MSNIQIIPTKNKFYNQLVNELIDEMKSGAIPWKQPWFTRTPTNFKTKKPYRGINIINLNFYAKQMGFNSHFWLTAKQALSMGGRIIKNEIHRNCYIIMAKWKSRSYKDNMGITQTICWLMVRNYPVYNLEQTIGLKQKLYAQSQLQLSFETKAEKIVKNYKKPPQIVFKYDSAYYRPYDDYIGMPSKDNFINDEEFYCTLFHELIHSTGHHSRLKRSSFSEKIKFEDEKYAKEEIIAEIGAAFLCGISGFLYKTKKNSAAYLQSWLTGLQNDHTLLYRATSSSQQAVDFILGKKIIDEKEPTLFDEAYPDVNWERNSNVKWS